MVTSELSARSMPRTKPPQGEGLHHSWGNRAVPALHRSPVSVRDTGKRNPGARQDHRLDISRGSYNQLQCLRLAKLTGLPAGPEPSEDRHMPPQKGGGAAGRGNR